MSDDPLRNPYDEPERDPAINPYAPTSFVSETEGEESDAEAFRLKYLRHEASIKSVGLLFFLPGVAFCLVSVAVLFSIGGTMLDANRPNGTGMRETVLVAMLACGMYGIGGVAQVYGGIKLRRLEKTGRALITIFCVFGFLALPVGPFLSLYFLWLMHGRRGQIVFSDEYLEAVRQTPHIKYQMSVVTKVFLWILVIVLAVGFYAIGVSG